jgi:hypothetical protein
VAAERRKQIEGAITALGSLKGAVASEQSRILDEVRSMLSTSSDSKTSRTYAPIFTAMWSARCSQYARSRCRHGARSSGRCSSNVLRTARPRRSCVAGG